MGSIPILRTHKKKTNRAIVHERTDAKQRSQFSKREGIKKFKNIFNGRAMCECTYLELLCFSNCFL